MSCVMCQTEDENMNHFRACIAHEKVPFEITWNLFLLQKLPKGTELNCCGSKKKI